MSIQRSISAALITTVIAGILLLPETTASADSFASVSASVQPKMVKIYGAGGVKGLEPYQSGFLISDKGHILTVMSYVLDTDYITVVLNDGRKFKAENLGADPRLEIAVLKVDAEDTPHFNLEEAIEIDSGDRILAFSNMYGVASGDEPTSVMHGNVAAKTKLDARRGTFKTPYQGTVYVLDAITNNPGAAGGALTNRSGKLVAILGKELRNSLNNTWLNYALPTGELLEAIDDIRAGKVRPRHRDEDVKKPENPHSIRDLGLILVPDVLSKTPPFVERVRRNSLAALAGLKPDDLILFVDKRMVDSCKSLGSEISYIDRIDEVRILVRRGQELIELTIEPR